MSALREKMIEDMQLRGFAVRTQEAYLLAVSQLARGCTILCVNEGRTLVE
jgi:hypothetical protein